MYGSGKPDLVETKLREIIRHGYRPMYTLESSEDHWVNFLEITEKRFWEITEEEIALAVGR